MTQQELERVKDWEQQVMRQCIADLLAAGYELTINNGGGSFEIPWSRDAEVVFNVMGQSDEDYIFLRRDTRKWVRFIYGNDGYDVINDYSSSLEQVLTNTNALVERLNKEWEEL